MDRPMMDDLLTKQLKIRISKDDTFIEQMKAILKDDKKYRENVDKLKDEIQRGSSFKDAFLRLGGSEVEASEFNDLDDVVEAVIKTAAVMPDDETKKQIFASWRQLIRSNTGN